MARRSTRTAAKDTAAEDAAAKAEAAKEEAEATKEPETVTVTARQPIRHDGRRFAAGDTFEVPPATRDELKAVGAIA